MLLILPGYALLYFTFSNTWTYLAAGADFYEHSEGYLEEAEMAFDYIPKQAPTREDLQVLHDIRCQLDFGEAADDSLQKYHLEKYRSIVNPIVRRYEMTGPPPAQLIDKLRDPENLQFMHLSHARAKLEPNWWVKAQGINLIAGFYLAYLGHRLGSRIFGPVSA